MIALPLLINLIVRRLTAAVIAVVEVLIDKHLNLQFKVRIVDVESLVSDNPFVTQQVGQ